MKCRMLLVISLMFIITMLSACSVPAAKPEEGIWYCDELMLEIDFNQVCDDGRPAKKYNSDGTYQNAVCMFDYGSNIQVRTLDWKENYVIGRFKYKHGSFTVTTFDVDEGDSGFIETYARGHTYIFERIDVTQT